jgi:hypothetical protein
MIKDLVFLTIPKDCFDGDNIRLSSDKIRELEKLIARARENMLGDDIEVVVTYLEKVQNL